MQKQSHHHTKLNVAVPASIIPQCSSLSINHPSTKLQAPAASIILIMHVLYQTQMQNSYHQSSV